MTAKGDTLPERLPPIPRAAYYDNLRVYIQSMGEINYAPLEWGWKLNENSLAPIMTNLDPSASYLPQCVICKCKAENRRCSKSICSCRKHRLKCVSSCGTCRGKSCENNVRDLFFISHFYKGSKRSESTISLYGSWTIAT